MSQYCATYARKSKKDRKCDMPGRNSLACIVLLLGLLYTVIASSATVLELKTGQKVEGDYLGGSATEIKIKVGSQVLVFPVQDVSRLHFVAPTPEGDFSDDSLKALRVLRGLQSVTKAGVNLSEYSRRVNDAAVEIDAFLDKYKRGHEEVLAEMREAMELYNTASLAWSRSFGKDYFRIRDEDLRRCPALRNFSAQLNPRFFPKGTSVIGLPLLTSSLPDLWSCADERVTKIEELVKPK